MIRIYTADQRFLSYDGGNEVKSIFNYGQHYESHRAAVGNLVCANEWKGLGSTVIQVPSLSYGTVIIVPLEEELNISIGEESSRVKIGQVFVCSANAAQDILITPLISDEVQSYSFYQFEFSCDVLKGVVYQVYDLPFLENGVYNSILPVFENLNAKLSFYVGAFVGKEEYDLHLAKLGQSCFVTIFNGTFEVEERLLFTGDSLYLSELDKINVESLSETGIIAVFTFDSKKI